MDADPEIVPYRGGRAVLMNALRILVTLVIVVAVVFAVKSQWAEVRDTITQLDWWALAVSAVFVFLGMGAAVRAWQHALGALEHPIPAFDAARCYLVGQLGKYLPGSVWAFVLQTELVRRAGGVSRANGFVAVLVTVGLSITSALVVGLLALPALFHISTVAAVAVIVLVPIALVCCYPPVLTRLVNLALRILRRAPAAAAADHAQDRAGPRLVRRQLGPLRRASVVPRVELGGIRGGHPGAVHRRDRPRHVRRRAGGRRASGIGGVREAVVVAALSPFMDSGGVALGLALASRLVFTLCEVLAGFVAAIAGSRSLRNALVHEDSRVPQPS